MGYRANIFIKAQKLLRLVKNIHQQQPDISSITGTGSFTAARPLQACTLVALQIGL